MTTQTTNGHHRPASRSRARRRGRQPLFLIAAAIGAVVAVAASTFVDSRRRRRVAAPRRRSEAVAPPPRRAPRADERAPRVDEGYGWPHTRREDGWAAGPAPEPAPLVEPAPLEPAPLRIETVRPVEAAAEGEALTPEPRAESVEPLDAAPPVEHALEAAEPVRHVEPAPQADEPAAAPPVARDRRGNLKTTKRILTLMLLAGIAVYFVGGGVFGSFSAETANPGSTAASGTLTMSDQVNSNTACISNDLTNGSNNVNAHCDALFTTLTNLAPGVFVSSATATVTVQNTGSIDASKLWVWAPPNSTTLSSGLTSGNAVTSLSVAALPSAVTSGQSVVVSSGANTQTFVASANASQGATAISVNSQNANFSYPSAAAVNVVDCLDAKTTTGGIAGATKGTDLNFNSTSGNPFCGAALLYVQEITGAVSGTPSTHNYCWLGANYGDSSGMCKAPISVDLSSPLSTGGAITSLPVTMLDGNVKSGDSIVVTSGTNQQTFTASADAYYGATSVPVSSATPTYAFPTTSTVTDSTTLGSLNSDTTDTITNFDTLHNGAQGPIELKTVTSNGTLQGSGPTDELAAGSAAARTFLVGVYFPQPAGNNQNALQGLSSTFGITWHVDQ